MNVFELTKSLMNIPSVSGDEEAVGFFLRDYLKSYGWTVELQEAEPKRNNVIAYLERNAARFSLDTYGHRPAIYRADRR